MSESGTTEASGKEASGVAADHIDWTEKYRPRTLPDVVGNEKAVKELRKWAAKWKGDKPDKKAVILAGKPGIGKTSSATALAGDMEWSSIEMNASDNRNSDSIKDIVGRGAVDDTFSANGEFRPYGQGKRTLLILDEADNIFGREDRGGIREMRNTVRKTEQPIVLIANDYYDLRRRSSDLANLCKKIDFEPVDEDKIIKHLAKICENEDIKFDRKALVSIAERSEGDIRSAVRDLESVAAGREKVHIEDLDSLGRRNKEPDIFPTIKTILQGRDPIEAKNSVRDLDEDPQNLLLWIDENLPREYKDPHILSSAYDKLSRADVFLGRVYRRQSYGFWRYANDLMTAGVSVAKPNKINKWTRYSFPTWLRKMSCSKGKRSMIKNISYKLAEYNHTTSDRVRSDILFYFKELLKDDESFRQAMVNEIEFTKGELSFLLDKDPNSAEIVSLYEKGGDEGEKEETGEAESKTEGREKKRERKKEEKEEKGKNDNQRSLMDF